MYDNLKQRLNKLSSRSYKKLVSPDTYETKLKEYDTIHRTTLPKVIDLYPDYKLDPKLYDKYTGRISVINQMDDKIKDLEKDITLQIKKTSVTMKEEDKELKQLRSIYSNLEKYTQGVGDLDTTSYQMLQDYNIIYKHQRIIYWIYIVFIVILTYLFIVRSNDKKNAFLVMLGTVIVLYIGHYGYMKWTERVWLPPGPTKVVKVEDPMPEEEHNNKCDTKECCGKGTEWDETLHQCVSSTF